MTGVNLSNLIPGERLKSVSVEWKYPRLLDNFWYDEESGGYGLYYISRKFGNKETLLYIGQTYDSYYNRLICHDYNWLGNYRGKKYVRRGIITSPVRRTDEDARQLLKDIESMLIYEMRFLLQQNVMGVNSYKPSHLYSVTNTGYRGVLSAEISMRNHIAGEDE